MVRSLTSVTLFAVALLSGSAHAQTGYSNATTASAGGVTPAAPVIGGTGAPAPSPYSNASTTAVSTSEVSTVSSEYGVSSSAPVSAQEAYTSTTTSLPYAPETSDATAETGVHFTYAPETSTVAAASLLDGNIAQSSAAEAASSNAAFSSSSGLVASTDLAAPKFVYAPSATEGSQAAAFQTSSSTTAPSAAYFFSPPSTHSPDTTITGAPTAITLGVATVSRDSAGNYMVGSSTLAPGVSITQVSGSSSVVIGLETTDGTTQLVAQEGSTETTTALPKITKPAIRTVTAPADTMSDVVVNGHTYHVGAASLNAKQTGSPTAAASSGIEKSGVVSASGTASSNPSRQPNGAGRSGWSIVFVGAGALVVGSILTL